MTEVPKIVYDRLRAALPKAGTAGAHPDADLLTAFAEQALSPTEREGVLEHLARCGDCRELIVLALPAVDTATPPIVAEAEAGLATPSRTGAPAPRKLSFAWPSLRWAALAAGVVVAGAVLLTHPGKLNPPAQPPVNQQVATAAQPISGPQNTAAPMPAPARDQATISAKTEAVQPKSELQPSKKLKTGQVVAPSPQADSGILLAEAKIAGNKKDVREADKLSADSSAGTRALNYNAPAAPRSNETVEVVAESPTAQGELSSDVGQNGAPAIAKAKPASRADTSQPQNAFSTTARKAPLQGSNAMSMAKLAASPSPTRAPSITWMIAAGVLQRSLDSGQNWQPALHADHSLLCYASHDQDVWTGGQAGTLFHSADSGITWLQVNPSIQGQPLTSDITQIDVRSAAEVVISTTTHETWSTTDNGKTWEKK